MDGEKLSMLLFVLYCPTDTYKNEPNIKKRRNRKEGEGWGQRNMEDATEPRGTKEPLSGELN